MHYDDEYDTLLVVAPSRDAISIELDGMMLRIDPVSGDILGFEIEDFVSVFVPAHPELPHLGFTQPRRKIERRIAGESDGLMAALIDLIKRLCGGGGW